MSPNTLVLPPAADALPAALRLAGIGLLGQAFALATSPVTPEGLLPLGQQIVYDRATILSQAGQRVGLQEPLESVVRDLLLDWSGNGYARLSDRFGTGQEAARLRAEQDFRGFDELLRRSRRGQEFADVVGAVLADGIRTSGVNAFMETWARETVSRAPQISALVAPSVSGLPLGLQITDPAARLLGAGAPGASIQRAVPFGTFVPLSPGSLAVIATPQGGLYEVAVASGGVGAFDLGLIVPDGAGLRQLFYSGVAMTAGATARVRFSVGGTNTYALEMDDNGDGTADRLVPPSLARRRDRCRTAARQRRAVGDRQRRSKPVGTADCAGLQRRDLPRIVAGGTRSRAVDELRGRRQRRAGGFASAGGTRRAALAARRSRAVREPNRHRERDRGSARQSDGSVTGDGHDRPDHPSRGRPGFRTRVDGRRQAGARRPDPASPHVVRWRGDVVGQGRRCGRPVQLRLRAAWRHPHRGVRYRKRRAWRPPDDLEP